nr:Aphid transmission factor protein [Dahlia common mosaic virus]
MIDNITSCPHIYKKNRYVKLKSLEPGTKNRRYTFASDNDKSNISSIARHCNNLNQIVARNWLKLSKLTSYLGLEKDESEPFSKNKETFNKFFKDLSKTFKEGGDDKEKQPNLLPVLEELSNRLGKLDTKIPKDLVTKSELEVLIKDFDKRLEKIQDNIKAIIG